MSEIIFSLLFWLALYAALLLIWRGIWCIRNHGHPMGEK